MRSLLWCIFCYVCLDANMDFYIATKQNNMNYAKKLLLDISDSESENYGKFMTTEEIDALIKTDDLDMQKVIDWLKLYDIEIIKRYGDALHCKINLDDIPSILVIPDHLKSIIELMSYDNGKDKNLFFKSPKISTPNNVLNNPNINVSSGFVGRETLNRFYNISNDLLVTTSVGAIEYMDNPGFWNGDVFLSQYYNSQTMNLVENIIGKNILINPESELDMQMLSQTANNATLWYWEASNWLYAFAVEFYNSPETPDVISMSWGYDETRQCDIVSCGSFTSEDYVDRVNNEYVKIGLKGITIVAASGDAGASGRVTPCSMTSPINPIFPGSSPYVVSVGGTFSVQQDENQTFIPQTPLCQLYGCTNGTTESISNAIYIEWTSGGGFSTYEQAPNWQYSQVLSYLNSGVPFPTRFNKDGRAYPDVSLLSHFCPTFLSAELMGIDGTSCSSPIFAAIVSILNTVQVTNGKPKLGFFNPLLYKMFSTDPSIFNDYSIGNNYCVEYGCCSTRLDGGSDFGYFGAVGFDTVYGLGTPNVGKMIDWLRTN